MTVAQLRRHFHGPAFVPKVSSPCKLCGKRIEAGRGFVANVDHPDIGVAHFDCAEGYCQTLEEYLPEDEAA